MSVSLPKWSAPTVARRPVKVALVAPPTITAPKTLSFYGAVPPLGLAYVAAAAEQAGHKVEVVDATGEGLERLRPWSTGVGEMVLQGLDTPEILERFEGPEVLGISHLFLHQSDWLRGFVAAARRRWPEVLIVLGGENATAHAGAWMARGEVDCCVLGEGEQTFEALLAAVAELPEEASRTQRSTAIASLPGLWGSAGKGPASPRNRNLDTVAEPAWHHFPVEAYLAAGKSGGVDRGPSMPVLTSRGCPFRCTFCSAPTMWGTRYERRSVRAVVDEIEGLQDRYGIRNVDLNDLTAMLTKDWILELCEEVEARGLNVTLQLPSGTRSEAIDEEAAEAMFRAGVRNFTYAPESGSEEVLRRIKKRVKLPSLRRSLRGAISAGLQTHASIIIGFPGERWQDLWQSWKLSQALADDGLHTLSVMVFAPYPGSALYEELRKSGRLIEDEAWYYGALLRSAGGGRSHHDFLDARALGGIQLAMLLTFFARQYLQRPERLLSIAGNLAKGEQRNVMDQFLATKLRQLRESRL